MDESTKQPVTRAVVEQLREAIKIDELARKEFDYNQARIARLKKRELTLNNRIEVLTVKKKELEVEILNALQMKFSVSDEIALSAARDTLTILEKRL